MKNYLLTIKVPSDQLSIYIELLSDSAQITVRPCQDNDSRSPVAEPRHHLVGRTLSAEIIAFLSSRVNGKTTKPALERHFSAIGANPVSVGPALSRTIKAGAVKRDGKQIVLLDSSIKVGGK